MQATHNVPNQRYENLRYFKNSSEVIYDYGRDFRVDKQLYTSQKKSEVTVVKEISIKEYVNIPNSIKEKIERSNYILNFKNNWDEDGAVAIKKIAYRNAISFLKSYAERILDVCGKDLLPPSISPVKDGSVDLEWNLSNSYLIINFTDSKEDFVYYYLAFRNGDKIIFDANGQIERKKINDKFASQLIDLS